MNVEGKVEVTGLSDVGRKRSHNEDSIGSDTSIGLTVLADGMGDTEPAKWPARWRSTDLWRPSAKACVE